MDDLATLVRSVIWQSCINDCAVPTIDEIAHQTHLRGREVRNILSALHEAHVVVLQPESGEILMAMPFSAVPTPFEVTAGERSWFANCIWDAMGIAAQIGETATIATSCPCCGDSMSISAPNAWLAGDPRVVHFALPVRKWWDEIVFT